MKEKKEKQKPNTFTPVIGVLVLLLAMVLWMNFGPLAAILYLSWPFASTGALGVVQDYITIHIPFLLMFLGLLFGANMLLKTKLRELLGSNTGYRWKYSLEVCGIYLLFSIILTLLHVRDVSVTPVPLQEKLLFVIPVLILTPLQATAEEIFFRALPARIVYKDILPDSPLKALPLSVICGFLFLLPHLGNAEVTASSNMIIPIIYYFAWGALAAYLAVATGGFEAPVAMHAMNNLYIALFVNYPDSSMPTSSIFVDSAPISSATTVIASILSFVIIFAFSEKMGYVLDGFKWLRRKNQNN